MRAGRPILLPFRSCCRVDLVLFRLHVSAVVLDPVRVCRASGLLWACCQSAGRPRSSRSVRRYVVRIIRRSCPACCPILLPAVSLPACCFNLSGADRIPPACCGLFACYRILPASGVQASDVPPASGVQASDVPPVSGVQCLTRLTTTPPEPTPPQNRKVRDATSVK